MTVGDAGYNKARESEVTQMQNNGSELRKSNKAGKNAPQDHKQEGGAQNCKHSGAQNKSDPTSKY